MKSTIQWTRNKPIYIIIDECTDPSGRFVLTILVGVLAEDASNPRLLDVRELNETNNQTVTQAINDSMIKLCDGQMDYSKLRVLISDSASYMLSWTLIEKKFLVPNLKSVLVLMWNSTESS